MLLVASSRGSVDIDRDTFFRHTCLVGFAPKVCTLNTWPLVLARTVCVGAGIFLFRNCLERDPSLLKISKRIQKEYFLSSENLERIFFF